MGDNYVCVMRAVTVVADVEGRPPGHAYHHMAKCFPMSQHWTKFLKEVSECCCHLQKKGPHREKDDPAP